MIRIFRCHLQTQKRSKSRYLFSWHCVSAILLVHLCQCEMAILSPFQISLQNTSSWRTSRERKLFTGPLDWKYQISFTEECNTMFTPSVDGFGTSEIGRFVSHIFNFPVMSCPDAITACAQSEELQEWQKMWEYKSIQAAQLEVTCLLILKYLKCQRYITDERRLFKIHYVP